MGNNTVTHTQLLYRKWTWRRVNMDKYGIRSKVIIQLITSASLKLYNIFIYFVRGKVEIVGRTSKQKL